MLLSQTIKQESSPDGGKGRSKVTEYCFKNHRYLAKALKRLGYTQFEYLASGCSANVYQISEEHVLRVSDEKPRCFPKNLPFNKRVIRPFVLDEKHSVYFEIFKKLTVLDSAIQNSHSYRALELSKRAEHLTFSILGSKSYFIEKRIGRYVLFDTHAKNLGLDEKQNIFIIDPGCVMAGPYTRLQVVA